MDNCHDPLQDCVLQLKISLGRRKMRLMRSTWRRIRMGRKGGLNGRGLCEWYGMHNRMGKMRLMRRRGICNLGGKQTMKVNGSSHLPISPFPRFPFSLIINCGRFVAPKPGPAVDHDGSNRHQDPENDQAARWVLSLSRRLENTIQRAIQRMTKLQGEFFLTCTSSENDPEKTRSSKVICFSQSQLCSKTILICFPQII